MYREPHGSENAVTAPGPRREYLAAEERRRQLLEAAAAVMVADGPSAISLRSVAERAGVAHRVVSYAFGSKAALVAALLQRESERSIAAAWPAPAPEGALAEVVRDALQRYLDTVRAEPRRHECLAALTATARLDPDLAAAARSEAASTRERIAGLAASWAAGADAAALVAALHAAAEGVAAWWLATRDDAAADAVVAAFAAGVAAQAPGRPQPTGG
jgi:AcrR family transcriptional regulator